MEKTQQFIGQNKEKFVAELFDLLRIPSVSADPAFEQNVTACAEFLATHFKQIGLDEVCIYPTAGHPIVYAEKIIDPALPTVLVYGHYDVQPADPLELWHSPAFEPVIKTTEIHPEGAIFARGACDDKGQFFMHVKALEAMLKSQELPCNVKLMIEGEEEIGSPNLAIFVKENKAKLKADIILVSDTGMLANDVPSITTGLRGLSYVEVEVTGPNRDLHSGLYGGCVANPINILTQMIASLHDENNHITIPGFYDRVQELSPEDRAEMAKAPYSEEAYCKALDLKATHGETGYSTMERGSIRPTLDVNGIWGGYTGEGAKTVLPAVSMAKVSFRLVPDQHPDVITALVRAHVERVAPAGVTVTVESHHGGRPWRADLKGPIIEAGKRALEAAFGRAPVITGEGGSIPVVGDFERILGAPVLLMGFGLPGENAHAPNEWISVENFLGGIRAAATLLDEYRAAVR